MNPDAIITADIHLRDDQPTCRTDVYWEEQERKILWLSALQVKYGCPILDAGDIFQRWNPSLYLVQWALNHLPDGMITVPGNHDLPAHSLDFYSKCGLSVLEAAGKVQVLEKASSNNLVSLHYENIKTPYGVHVMLFGYPWGIEPVACNSSPQRRVALCHYMTYMGRAPFPGCKDPGADLLLRKLSGYDLIITGHNHKTFVLERDGRILVNPGSFTRHKSDQADHKPCVFLWYAKDNRVEQVFVPIVEGVISREHLEVVEQKDQRIEAFVSKLNENVDIGLSFEDNLENLIASSRVRKATQTMVWEFVNGNGKN